MASDLTVVRSGERWEVRQGSKPLSRHSTQQYAMDAATTIAAEARTTVVWHDRHGRRQGAASYSVEANDGTARRRRWRRGHG